MTLRLLLSAALAAVATLASPHSTVAADGAAAIDARKAHFKQLGADFKLINEAVRSSNWTSSTLAPMSQRVAASAHALPSWFPPGSGPGGAQQTHAKAAIWTDTSGFSAAASALAVQADRLDEMVRAGNTAGVADQVKSVGQACASCHAKYREKD